MEETGLGLLRHQLDAQIERVKECMVEQALAHEEYLRLRGLIQGLSYGKEIINALAKQMENDDE